MKKYSIVGLALAISLSASFSALAGEWKQDTVGWWYQNDDSSYPTNSWQLINEKCYYFDENGYMLADTVAPGGYTVNADGAWTNNGEVVEVKKQFPLPPTGTPFSGNLIPGVGIPSTGDPNLDAQLILSNNNVSVVDSEKAAQNHPSGIGYVDQGKGLKWN